METDLPWTQVVIARLGPLFLPFSVIAFTGYPYSPHSGSRWGAVLVVRPLFSSPACSRFFFPSILSIAGVWYTCYFVIWSCVWNARNHNVNETEKQRKTHTNPEENILASKDLFLVVHVQVNINAGRPYSHLMSTTTHSKVSSLSRLTNCLTWHLLILPCHYFVSTWP